MRIQSLQELHQTFPDIDGYWNLLDLTQTKTHIQSLLPSPEAIYLEAHVEALTQLLRVFSLQGRFEEAHSTIILCQTHLERLAADKKIRPTLRYHLEEGRFFCLSMTPAKGLESFKQAWLMAEENSLTYFAIDSAYMLSITLPQKQGKEWRHKAIGLAETTIGEFQKPWLAQLYMMEGWSAFDGREFERALINFEKAIHNHAATEACVQQTRRLFWCRGRALRALNRCEEALLVQERLYDELQFANETNGHVLLEMAECLQALMQVSKARSYYEAAYILLKADTWFADNNDYELSRIQKNSKK